MFMMFCIYPIVAKPFEMFFRDVDNQFFDEVQSRNGFSNSLVVFVSGVMKGYIFTVIIINTRCGNNRSAKVTTDVLNGDIRSAKIWFCTNIKTVGMFGVHFNICLLTLQEFYNLLHVTDNRKKRKEI